jgi:hypothetical protein
MSMGHGPNLVNEKQHIQSLLKARNEHFNKKVAEKKQLILTYPDKRSIFKHPETKEEFQKLFDRMIKCREIDDIVGVYTCAMQLIPTIFVEK